MRNQQAQGNNNYKNNAQNYRRQVNFDDNVNDFAEAVANQDDDADDTNEQDAPFQQGTYLLDSAAFPSH